MQQTISNGKVPCLWYFSTTMFSSSLSEKRKNSMHESRFTMELKASKRQAKQAPASIIIPLEWSSRVHSRLIAVLFVIKLSRDRRRFRCQHGHDVLCLRFYFYYLGGHQQHTMPTASSLHVMWNSSLFGVHSSPSERQ